MEGSASDGPGGTAGAGIAIAGAPDAGAGDVGVAGGAPAIALGEPCAKPEDCDDGSFCNGQESCVAGSCAAGTAPACDTNMQCVELERACVFSDASPWVIYMADDDTPGVTEAYAVKRDLIGKMDPVKLNDALEPGWITESFRGWTPDPQLFSFNVSQSSAPYRSAVELVYFGHGLPGKPQRLEGYDIRWSPSWQLFAVIGENGVSINAYSGNGNFETVLTFESSDYTDFYGYWTPGDEFVFSQTSRLGQVSRIQRAVRDGAGWKVLPLLDGLVGLSQFELSPTGKELTYHVETSDGRKGPLYALALAEGSKPKVLLPGGEDWVSWSPDGSRFLLFEAGRSGATLAFFGAGSVCTQKPEQIAANQALYGGAFTPDGKQIMLWKPFEDWGVDWALFDSSDDSTNSFGASVGPYRPWFAPDDDLGLLPTLDSADSPLALTLFSLSGQRWNQIDSIPSGSEYADVQFSAHTEFAAYTKGKYPNYDGAYVDLRYALRDPKPVRLPGEGNVYRFELDSSGTGIYYVREKANGARDCFYLDLSGQVAAEPVKVSRNGRVDSCGAQPVFR
jgi:hypothetical protein